MFILDVHCQLDPINNPLLVFLIVCVVITPPWLRQVNNVGKGVFDVVVTAVIHHVLASLLEAPPEADAICSFTFLTHLFWHPSSDANNWHLLLTNLTFGGTMGNNLLSQWVDWQIVFTRGVLLSLMPSGMQSLSLCIVLPR